MRIIKKIFIIVLFILNINYTLAGEYQREKDSVPFFLKPFMKTCSNTERWNDNTREIKILKNSLLKNNKSMCNRKGCLKQLSLHSRWPSFEYDHCMENVATDEEIYSGKAEYLFFEPQLRIRTQVSHIFTYKTYNFTLGIGECKFRPWVLGFPVRYCARIAVPATSIKMRGEIKNRYSSAKKELNKTKNIAKSLFNSDVMSELDNIYLNNTMNGTTMTKRGEDPGYIYFWHLNEEGAFAKDKYPKQKTGEEIEVIGPKLCAYVDPWIGDVFLHTLYIALPQIKQLSKFDNKYSIDQACYDIKGSAFKNSVFCANGKGTKHEINKKLDIVTSVDLFDFLPTYQPFHDTGELSPIIQTIVDGIDGATNVGQFSLSFALNTITGGALGKGLNNTIIFLIRLTKIVGGSIKTALTALGQLNKIVYSQLGCVEIPIGPFPPAYRPRLHFISPMLSIEKICPVLKHGFIDEPNQKNITNKCVLSNADNNFIHNTVRVEYNIPIYFCKPGQNPYNDLCVRFKGISNSFKTHFFDKDQIKVCNYSNKTNCVDNTDVAYLCKLFNMKSCPNRFRAIYGLMDNNGASDIHYDNYYSSAKAFEKRMILKLKQKDAFRYTELKEDKQDDGLFTQIVDGINLGNYNDLTVDFSNNLNESNSQQSKTVTMQFAKDQKAVKVYATIDIKNNPEEICVYAKYQKYNQKIGCFERAPLINIDVISKGDNNHFKPELHLKNKIKIYDHLATQKILRLNNQNIKIIPPTEENNGDEDKAEIMIAGYTFEAMITDEQNTEKTSETLCSGVNNAIPYPMCGNYINNDHILNIEQNYESNPNGYVFFQNFNKNVNSYYIDGLEFLKHYNRGGKYICLKNDNFELGCFGNDKHQCILTKTIPSNINSNRIPSNRIKDRINPKPSIGAKLNDDQYHTDEIFYIECKRLLTNKGYSVIRYNNTNNYEKDPYKSYDWIFQDNDIPLMRVTCNLHKSKNDDDINNYFSISYKDMDDNELILRNKTSFEKGLCTSISKPPTCKTEIKGNAKWQAAEVGEVVLGICNQGLEPISQELLKRTCILNYNNVSKFTKLKTKDVCIIPEKRLQHITLIFKDFIINSWISTTDEKENQDINAIMNENDLSLDDIVAVNNYWENVIIPQLEQKNEPKVKQAFILVNNKIKKFLKR